MKLHLTINGRWAHSVLIDPNRRSNREYMEDMKRRLLDQYERATSSFRGSEEYYTDPAYDSQDNELPRMAF